ncbi:MAG: transglutaminase domain-containing protein [Methanoregula sp.]|jgi:transglutaminase-like putative cysteine protease|uniref:transglutaminase-like domain-containing protein n=1 Tax=Methanoregula sp. TaxID=2052170 RepID=UPI003D112D09
MRQIPVSFLAITVLIIAALLTAGCTTGQPASPAASGDALLVQADLAYRNANYMTAAQLYNDSYTQYTAAGNTSAARDALNHEFTAYRMIIEFPLNRTDAESAVRAAFPDASADQVNAWLSARDTARITSDGRELFFYDTVANIRYHDPARMRMMTAASGKSPFYDEVKDLALDPPVAGRDPLFDEVKNLTLAPPVTAGGPYRSPVTFEITQQLSVPVDSLPKTGVLRLWVPAPINSGSQTNVTVISIEPVQYVKFMPDTRADIGLAYMEVPLSSLTGEYLNITTRYGFIQHEQRFVIDPAKVRAYNTSDPEYLKYTASGKNIVITPEMKQKAQEIVGNETNPYLQARMIYWYIVNTLPYSHAPHIYLDAAGIPESTYVLDTGIGDCGSQSMYFAALCRSLGIPARAVGGYQLVPGLEGTHFWAEYYLVGYGWVPVDVTIAEGGDWAYNATPDQVHRWKEYYFGSLDPYRYIIQNDVDIPIVPDPGNAVMFRMVVQSPKIACDTCNEDVDLLLTNNWTTVVKRG